MRFALLYLVASLGLAGCLLDDDSGIVEGQCHVEGDQLGSFKAKLNGIPVHVVIDADFTASERSAIQSAIATWNAFGQQLLRSDIFFPRVAPMPFFAKNFVLDECERKSHRDDTLYIVRENSPFHWNTLDLHDSAMAVTMRCTGGAGKSKLLRQVMIINPDQAAGEIQGVALHELGHAMGLGHPCATDRDKHTTDLRACSSIGPGHPYYEAVMFPRASANGAKTVLQDNDKMRARCLYGAE